MECPHCGCDAVINDKIGSQEQSICSECGLVVSDQTFEEGSADCYFDAPPTGSIPAGASASLRALKRESDGKNNLYSPIGLTEIDLICDALKLGSTEKDEAVYLYQQACVEPQLNVRFRSRLFKEVLGACCVYIILRKHQYPITAREIVALRRLPINEFIIMLRRLKKFMQVDFPRWSIGELTAHTLKNALFNREMTERTQKLMQICDKCWLVTGRNPESIIKAAAYFSWLSFQEPGKSDKDLGIDMFCKLNNLSLARGDGVIRDMKSILIKMAKHIPWVIKYQQTRFRYYIPDIVKYKFSLMKKAFTEAGPSDSSNGNCPSESDLLPFRKKPKIEVKTGLKTSDEIDAEISLQYGHVLDSTEIGQTEFDDEIDQYIKTEQEKDDAEVIRNLRIPDNKHVLKT